MSEICTQPAFLLGLLDEVSRHRALEPHETDLIEDILAMDAKPFRWNPRLEGQLIIAANSPGGLKRFALRHGVDILAVRQKLWRMRKRNPRLRDTRRVKVQGVGL